MRSMLSLGMMLVMFLLMDCSNSEYKPTDEEKCMVGRYVYKQESGTDVSYKISYVEGSLTRPDLITNDVLSGDTWVTDATYKHIYRNDSLYIKDFRQFREGDTYLTALYNTKIQTVITTLPDNGGKYRYTFDYAQANQVTVTLEELIDNSAIFDSRGVYHLDDRTDVVKLDITRDAARHAGDADNFTSREIIYTYDIVLNPIKELVIPNFFAAQLPDVTYFSMHNRLTRKYDDVTKNYTITYGTDPMPSQIVTPEGVAEKFEYPNCTN